MNGALCIGGTPEDYDGWELEGWSGKEFFKYMAKSENFHSKPWFDAATEGHGTSGPLHTEPRELAPISKLLMKSLESKGLPYHADMFTTGGVPDGHGHIIRSHWQGRRSMAADFITTESKANGLTIKVNTLVNKVLLEQRDGNSVAVGVEILNQDLSRSSVYARREVIVSGGSYCTPAILLRSGIGHRDELDHANISCRVHLPGVGKNLLDHLIVFAFYEVENKGITNDHLIHNKEGYKSTQNLWKTERTGILSSSLFGLAAFARLDNRLKDSPLWNNAPREAGRDPMGLAPQQPNVEFLNTEFYGGLKKFGEFPEDKSAFGLLSYLFSPRSHGTVTILSKDPQSPPVIDHNFLSDPLDLLVLSEGCRFGNEIVMTGDGTASVIKGAWPPEAKHHTYDTREAWQDYVKDNATSGFHAGGTCKMGKSGDKMAVVDEKLRVKEVKNLRIADCSIMPTLNGGHTQMLAYGIGEKAADLIKESVLLGTSI